MAYGGEVIVRVVVGLRAMTHPPSFIIKIEKQKQEQKHCTATYFRRIVINVFNFPPSDWGTSSVSTVGGACVDKDMMAIRRGGREGEGGIWCQGVTTTTTMTKTMIFGVQVMKYQWSITLLLWEFFLKRGRAQSQARRTFKGEQSKNVKKQKSL